MAVGHEQLTPEERSFQAGLERSRQHARQLLADPHSRASIERKIQRVTTSLAEPMSKDEFLARTEPLIH